MIVIRLKGGLGNQMFQYAYGRNLSYRQKTVLKLDKSFLNNTIWQRIIGVTPRKYELGEFNIKARLTNKKYKNRLEGYWQSEKYFKDIRKIICKDFTLKKKSSDFDKLAKIISQTNSVGIHFRRGDYVKRAVTRRYHGVLGFDYYFKAIELMRKKIKTPRFFVFSDDPMISNFSGLTDAEELILMSLCKHNIIANSSFSWWGAWLNKNPAKKIIAPKSWFKAKVSDEEIIPPSWVRL